MAEEGSEGSVATSSSTPNWWELHANPMASWGALNAWHPPTHNSSSCEGDISISNSFTNASNHSGLSMDESASAVTELSGEPTSNNHLWRQVLLSVGSGGESNNGQYDDGGSLLKGFSWKNPTMELLEPDLKKLDNCWEFANPVASFNNMEKQINSYDGSLMGSERLTNLSDMVNNWSIAPPDQHAATPAFLSNGGLGSRNSSCMPCYGHEMKVESGQQHGAMAASDEGAFLRSCTGTSMEYQMSHSQTITGDNSSKYHYEMLPDVPWSNSRAFSDFISFGGCLNKPLVDFHTTKNCTKASNPADHSKKQGHDQTSSTRGIGRGVGGSNEAKKKRSEDNSDTAGFKKPKNDNSTASSMKDLVHGQIQAPKVKLADKISALQQIVSPFGKTDTASVLFEAIGYIKFLQEQVQLLSNPYMKPSFSKDHSPWGGLERKDKSEVKHDLKSRGLCLVPISCTPQVYRENNGSDYWTPAYRGCLYR